jgi:hypothetical protein
LPVVPIGTNISLAFGFGERISLVVKASVKIKIATKSKDSFFINSVGVKN